MANYFSGATASPSKDLDIARLREEFPQIVKTWDQMNLAERAAATKVGG